MGPGKADLLDAIPAHGSISAADRALGMSYRDKWLQADGMNRCFEKKLVEATASGRGGGVVVTDHGRLVLAAYRELEAALIKAAHDHPRLVELETLMRNVPLNHGGGGR